MQQLIGPTTVTGKTTKIFSDDTLFNVVIGNAALSGVLALLLAVVIFLICKLRQEPDPHQNGRQPSLRDRPAVRLHGRVKPS